MSSGATPIQEALAAGGSRRTSYEVRRGGASLPEKDVLGVWKDRRANAKSDRSRYEPDWYLCQSYVANKQWVGWSDRLNRVLSVLDDPREAEREHHTENVITNYLWTGASQLMQPDFRPDLTFRTEDLTSRKFAEEAAYALAYAWDEELDADDVLFDAILDACCYGTSGVRCFYRRGLGDDHGEWPVGPDGKLITDPQRSRDFVSQAIQEGRQVKFEHLQGQLLWEPLSPFNMLPPPGIRRYQDFPWLIIERAVPIETLKAMWPQRAGEIEPQDLEAIDAIGLRELVQTQAGGSSSSAKLSGHALLGTGYEQPTRDFPAGRVVYWTKDVLLEEVPQLPYKVAGRPVAGVVPFHYKRVPGRFWGMGIVEPGLGVQRERNRSRSQHIEHKDRNLGRVYAIKGTITQANRPRGKIMELIEVAPGHQFPQETTVPPLQNVQAEVQMLDDAMNRVTGFSNATALSSPPAGVVAYAGMALAKESDQERNRPIETQIQRQIIELSKVTLAGIKAYWPPGKEILHRTESGELASFIFNSTDLPETVLVSFPKGAPRPDTPAAQIQLCFDMFDRSVSSGQVLPLRWLKESLTAGKPLPLPDDLVSVQHDKAEYENLLMEHGQLPDVAPYDNDQLHVQVHRADEAIRQLEGSEESSHIVGLLELHIKQHEQSAQQKASAPSSSPQAQGPLGALGGRAAPGEPAPAMPAVLPGLGNMPQGLPGVPSAPSG